MKLLVVEEKRTKKGAQERIMKQARPWMFAGSKFELHDVIGSEEVITEAPRDRFVDATRGDDGFAEFDALDWRQNLMKKAADMRRDLAVWLYNVPRTRHVFPLGFRRHLH